ncbi:MAG TPA: HD domain-containing phosphohydrolase, partial [Solirubrobacteraceae bacterium]|nr:HD domain-containing phosphohydrolase [Solirubrobacteraceae bacterium]
MTVRDHMPGLSRLRGSAKPHLTGAAERLHVVGNERRRNPAERREAIVETGCALTFLAVAIALPLLFHAGAPDPYVTLALIVTMAVTSRVEFDVGAGYTAPTQLVFVPMLFLVDPAWAPLIVAVGLALGRIDKVLHGDNVRRSLLVTTGNAWYTIGPVLVLASFGIDSANLGDWPIYLAALAAQLVVDTVAGMSRERLVSGVQPVLQLRMTGLVFLVDVLLTPVGFLAAYIAQDEPLAFLLALPLVALLRIFARERAARIDQAIELSAAYRGTALLLGEVIAEDDEYTGEHSYGVIALSLEIAYELGLDEDERRLVEFGALLHDVGKIAIPKEIVNKEGPLDEEEWSIMRTHTIAGEEMLNKVGGSMSDIGKIVRASHERWDGGGYPDGTAGQDVPLPA